MIKNEYKLQAKVLLSGNWFKCVIVTLFSLAYIIISELLVDIIASFFYNNIITGILLFLDVFIILPILYSSTITIKNITTSEYNFHYSDLLKVAIANIKRVFKVGGLLFVEMLPALLIFILSFSLFIWTIFKTAYIYAISHYFVSAYIVIITITFLLIVIFFSLLIKKCMVYLLASFVMDENTNLKMMEIITTSKIIFKNNKKKFLSLNTSFVLWILLSIFTLGIGFLILIPYMKLSFYQAYKAIDK